MEDLSRAAFFVGDEMHSPERHVMWLNRWLPEVTFYSRLFMLVLRGGYLASRGRYTGVWWSAQSEAVSRYLEDVGCRFHVEGMDHFKTLSGPCVFASNHMSTLETMCLPAVIQPFKDVTFVVKQSLLRYPVFGTLLRARGPIPLARLNPRDDLKLVLEAGTEKLARGQSIIVFPQGGRFPIFDPAQFNSMAVKLARRAGVPVVPLAIDTRAWGEGRQCSDFGPIRPKFPIRFRFGAPLTVEGSGKEAQEETLRFIISALTEWGVPLAAH